MGRGTQKQGRGFVLRRPRIPFHLRAKQSEHEKEINRILTLYLQFLMEVKRKSHPETGRTGKSMRS